MAVHQNYFIGPSGIYDKFGVVLENSPENCKYLGQWLSSRQKSKPYSCPAWKFLMKMGSPIHDQKHQKAVRLEACEMNQLPVLPKICMNAGPRITANRTGRKKRIIGTVSFGGNAAAFFSASAMRMSRFSWARTLKAVPRGVP